MLSGTGRTGITTAVLFCAWTAFAKQCAVCDQKLPDQAYLLKDQVADVKKSVCPECAKLTTVCYLCGLPTRKDYSELPDGRILCARDAKTAVLDEKEALQICREVKKILDGRFFRFIKFPETNVTLKLPRTKHHRAIGL
jgi:hypothetical protein